MMNDAKTLFIFEGSRAEDKYYVKKLTKFSATDSRPQMSNINAYNKDIWVELIAAHILKANYLVHDLFEFPQSLISQQSIFESQIEKYISHRCPQVAVLSAFPLYVLDYYGINNTIKKLNP